VRVQELPCSVETSTGDLKAADPVALYAGMLAVGGLPNPVQVCVCVCVTVIVYT
jgi:hypothetical protein